MLFAGSTDDVVDVYVVLLRDERDLFATELNYD